MKTYPVLHKPRFWIAAVLCLPLAPLLALCIQIASLPSLSEFNRLDSFVQKHWESQFGKDITPELKNLDKQLAAKLSNNALMSLAELMNSKEGQAPISVADATTVSKCVKDQLGDLITNYARVSQSGGAWQQPDFRQDLISTAPGAMVDAACLLSEIAAEAGDWDTAIARAEEAAHIHDGYRALGIGGQYGALYKRSYVYSLYSRLLLLRPNGQVSKRIVKSLRALEASDPVSTSILPINFTFNTHDDTLREDYNPALFFVYAQLWKTMRLKEAVDGIINDLTHLGNPPDYVVSTSGFQTGSENGFWGMLYPWTSNMAKKSFLRKAVRLNAPLALADPILLARTPKEQIERAPKSDLVALRHWKPALDAGFDPALVAMYDYEYGYYERVDKTRAVRTQNLMLQAAFASRAFREEHDRWPKELSELAPQYIDFKYQPPINADDFYLLKTKSDPLPSIKVSEVAATEEVILERLRPLKVDPHIAVVRFEVNNRKATLTANLDTNSNHLLQVARLAQAVSHEAEGERKVEMLYSDGRTSQSVEFAQVLGNEYCKRGFAEKLCSATPCPQALAYGPVTLSGNLSFPESLFCVSCEPFKSGTPRPVSVVDGVPVVPFPRIEYPGGLN